MCFAGCTAVFEQFHLFCSTLFEAACPSLSQTPQFELLFMYGVGVLSARTHGRRDLDTRPLDRHLRERE